MANVPSASIGAPGIRVVGFARLGDKGRLAHDLLQMYDVLVEPERRRSDARDDQRFAGYALTSHPEKAGAGKRRRSKVPPGRDYAALGDEDSALRTS